MRGHWSATVRTLAVATISRTLLRLLELLMLRLMLLILLLLLLLLLLRVLLLTHALLVRAHFCLRSFAHELGVHLSLVIGPRQRVGITHAQSVKSLLGIAVTVRSSLSAV